MNNVLEYGEPETPCRVYPLEFGYRALGAQRLRGIKLPHRFLANRGSFVEHADVLGSANRVHSLGDTSQNGNSRVPRRDMGINCRLAYVFARRLLIAHAEV